MSEDIRQALDLPPCDQVAEAEALGYKNIWSKRFGEGLAAAYLEREGDSLVIEFFENHGA